MKDYSFLLDRPERKFPEGVIDQYFSKRRVLVTGAGGTIGSALCKRLAGIAQVLVGIGHSEAPIFRMRSENVWESVEYHVADVRRPLDGLFRKWQFDTVIHAAAHKHVGLLEGHRCEAYTNNVDGTINVAQKAMQHGVERFVFLSTDKAACPTSVMGKSKRMAELWLLAHYPDARIVRCGNVLGSSGSLVEIMERKIADGESIELTDPKMVRWFITVREVVGLILMAAIFSPGIYTLDMGVPVNIGDIANRLVAASGCQKKIIFGKPGPGEKLTEHLTNPGEKLVRLNDSLFGIDHPEVTNRDVEVAYSEFFGGCQIS